MIVLAHILGIPVEESIVPLASSMTPAMLLGFAMVVSRVRARTRQ
jgi:hypothetical protein